MRTTSRSEHMGTAALSAAERYIFPLAFAFAPTLMLLLTWKDLTSMMSWAIRFWALPVLAVEVAVILAAVANGMRPSLPRNATIALSMLIAVAWISAAFAPDLDGSLIWT